MLLVSAGAAAQMLYGEHRTTAQLMEPTYAGERCAFYDVHRLSSQEVLGPTGGQQPPPTHRRRPRLPRLGELVARPRGAPNATICDGYGVKRGHVAVPCTECPGDPFRHETWPVLLCAPRPMAPVAPPLGSGASGAVNLLLVGADHNNHGLFAQVERVLNQLLLAENLGLPAYVYLGRKVVAAPWACDVGENQYFDPRSGDNVWEYFFEQVAPRPYQIGDATLGGRPVRLLLVPGEDARRHGILASRDAVCSYFEFGRYDETLHEIRTRVRLMGARLVRRWLRVKLRIRREAHALLSGWRAKATHLLGVHLRGTDKVTHPKVPLSRFVGVIDAFLSAHPHSLIVLATDDAKYHSYLKSRYGERVVSASGGFATANVVRDPSINPHAKGYSGLLDALLLAHSDFLIKATSSLAEFAIWHSPGLIHRHIDVQFEGKALESPTYRRLLPRWMGGPYEPPPLAADQQPQAMLHALWAADGGAGGRGGGGPGGDAPPGGAPPAAAAAAASESVEEVLSRLGPALGGREGDDGGRDSLSGGGGRGRGWRRAGRRRAAAARAQAARQHGRLLERLLPPPASRQRRRLSGQAAQEGSGLPPAGEHAQQAQHAQRTQHAQHAQPDAAARASPVGEEGGAGGRAGGLATPVRVPVPVPVPVPEWPLPAAHPTLPTRRPAQPVAFVAIRRGESCASRGLALLGAAACEALASQLPGHKYIGATREPTEYPGCIRWGGGFVEHNGHEDERGVACAAGGEAQNGFEPACLCDGHPA